jgi:hypothetical protein
VVANDTGNHALDPRVRKASVKTSPRFGRRTDAARTKGAPAGNLLGGGVVRMGAGTSRDTDN